MKKDSFKQLAAILVMIIALTPAVFAQRLVIEPDSLDFGMVQVGLTGLPENYRSFTVTNNTNTEQIVRISTINLLDPESVRIYDPEKAEVHPILRQIMDAVGCYRQDHSEDPSRAYELVEQGYLHIAEDLLWRWQFHLIGQDPVTQIEAEGENGSVILDAQIGRFYEPIQEFSLYRGNSKTFVMAYEPREEEQLFGFIGFTYGENQDRIFVQDESAINCQLDLSQDQFDFGEVYAGRRATERITITNTSGLLSRIYCESSDPNLFYAFDDIIEPAHDFILRIDDAIVTYHQANGEDPNSVERLIEENYIEMPEILDRQWSFSLSRSDPVIEIRAMSTGENPDGAGHALSYDRQTDQFFGRWIYANSDDNHVIILGKDRSAEIVVAFNSHDYDDHYGTLRLRSYNYERDDVFQGYDIRLEGRGMAVPSENFAEVPSTLLLSPAFPNPFNSTAIISFQTPFTGAINASLVDESGREWRKFEIPAVAGVRGTNGRFALDGAGLPAGAYWVKVTQGGQSAQQRVVLVK